MRATTFTTTVSNLGRFGMPLPTSSNLSLWPPFLERDHDDYGLCIRFELTFHEREPFQTCGSAGIQKPEKVVWIYEFVTRPGRLQPKHGLAPAAT